VKRQMTGRRCLVSKITCEAMKRPRRGDNQRVYIAGCLQLENPILVKNYQARWGVKDGPAFEKKSQETKKQASKNPSKGTSR